MEVLQKIVVTKISQEKSHAFIYQQRTLQITMMCQAKTAES